jgi:hypothetical protein
MLMWKQVTAAILLLAFMTSSFCRSAIVLDYYTNAAAFAKNCENKARPKMHCNGKCQMMKKLKQEDKKDQNNPERKAENKNELVSSTSFFTAEFLSKQATRHCSARIIIQKPVDKAYSILRPPVVA